MTVLVGFLLMTLMEVFMGTVAPRRVLVIVAGMPLGVLVPVLMLMAMGMLMQVRMGVAMGHVTVAVGMLVFMPVPVVMLVAVLVLAFHDCLLHRSIKVTIFPTHNSSTAPGRYNPTTSAREFPAPGSCRWRIPSNRP